MVIAATLHDAPFEARTETLGCPPLRARNHDRSNHAKSSGLGGDGARSRIDRLGGPVETPPGDAGITMVPFKWNDRDHGAPSARVGGGETRASGAPTPLDPGGARRACQHLPARR